MIKQVNEFITRENLFNKGEQLLVACSGGKDSMALLYILQELGYTFVVAHCNFQLRGVESDKDEQFIRSYCEKNQLSFECVSFQTEELAKGRGLSIQECARELRYSWFEEKRRELVLDYILTAHHLQDNIETLVYKLVKGTGIKGIRGMLPKQSNIVRPLLETPLEDLLRFIEEHSISYREDTSNSSTKYNRNKIRLDVLPQLETINPQLRKTLQDHFKRWRDIEQFHKQVIKQWKKKLFHETTYGITLYINELKALGLSKTLLYELFQEYDFNEAVIGDLLLAMNQTASKEFHSATHRIIKDRKYLVIQELCSLENSSTHLIQKNTTKVVLAKSQELTIAIKPIDKVAKTHTKPHHAYIDISKLEFPLVVRKWETGDYFYPIGQYKANGKPAKKKISKYLKDEKLGQLAKEKLWVVCSNNKVVSLLGYRLDERFKITPNTQEVLYLKFLES